MIFKNRLKTSIFIHVPKTGGNYIQKLFELNNMSLDKLVKKIPHQDGINRFEVHGTITKRKHQTLFEYYEKDPSCYFMPIFTCIRKPFERLVSFYFSPFRWITTDKKTGQLKYPQKILFKEEEFLNLVRSVPPSWTYLSLSKSEFIPPKNKINFLKTETLSKDISFHFPHIKLISRKINTSIDKNQSSLILESKSLRNFVENSKHKKDLDIFYG